MVMVQTKSELCLLCPVFFFQGSLNLARRLGLSMPDVPHDEMVALLLDAWDCVVYKTGHTRKQMYRKVSHAKLECRTIDCLVSLRAVDKTAASWYTM